MTIKEKAKAYDKLLTKAKQIYNNENDVLIMHTIEDLFPQVKESEEERIRKMIINHLTQERGSLSNDEAAKAIAWIETQGDKDKLIKELGEYKVKYTQEVLEKHINNMSNKDDERLRKTTMAFLKDFAEQGYENAVECIDWLEEQSKQKSVFKMKTPEESLDIDSDTYNKIVDECIYGDDKQKPIIDGILTATNYDKMFQNCNVHNFNIGDTIKITGINNGHIITGNL